MRLQPMRKMKANVAIYSDGPAAGGTTVGGATLVATVGDSADPVIIHASKIGEAELIASDEEQKVAIQLGKGHTPFVKA